MLTSECQSTGDKPQEERDWVLQQFRSAEHPLLVATDVAQRGLDVKGERRPRYFEIQCRPFLVCAARSHISASRRQKPSLS